MNAVTDTTAGYMNSHDRTLAMMLEGMLRSYRGWRSCDVDHDDAVDRVIASSCAGPRTREAFKFAAAELSWSL